MSYELKLGYYKFTGPYLFISRNDVLGEQVANVSDSTSPSQAPLNDMLGNS